MSMLVAVLGGLAFQVPIGRLSDRFDRRIVLAAFGLGFAGTTVALVLLDIDEAQKVKSRWRLSRGTGSSNPTPSTEESANFRSLSGGAALHRERQFPFVIWKNDTRGVGHGRV